MKSSFNTLLKLREVKRRVHSARTPLTHRQKVPGAQGKIKSVLARLGRLRVEHGSAVSEGEHKRRTVLFECVSSTHC